MEKKRQDYTLRNLSGAPITLRLLDLSPGVTVSGPALERTIPARGTAALVLQVDPAGWVGPQARNVRLGTDDPGQGWYYLPVRLTVRPDLTVDGTRRDFGDVGIQESPRVQFGFVRATGKPLALELSTPLPDYLECQASSSGPRGGLAFTLRPDRIPPGTLLGLERIGVETNAPLQPRVDLYLAWRIHRAIEAIPARVVFQDPRPDTLDLRLKSRAGTPFRILEARVAGQGFRLGALPAGASPEQRLTVCRTAPGPARAMLVLICSEQDAPLEIPLVYVAAAPASR